MPKNKSLYCILIFLIVTILSSLTLASDTAQRHRPKVKQITDLRIAANEARLKKVPILLMFGTTSCPYCRLLKEDFLIPMLISGDYEHRVLIREVHVTPRAKLIDFSGEDISVKEFKKRYKVRLYPTTIFIDANGKQLVDSILGVTTPSLFGGTLDDQIDRALAKLKKRNH